MKKLSKVAFIFLVIVIVVVSFQHFFVKEPVQPKKGAKEPITRHEKKETNLSESQKSPYVILGYYTKYTPESVSSDESLKKNGSYFNSVSMASYNLDQNGQVHFGGMDPKDGIEFAKSSNKTMYASFSNPDFEPVIAHSILSNQQMKDAAIQNILKIVNEQGFHGVNVDLEGMYPTDRNLYSTFILELAEKLKSVQKRLIVSVPAKSDDCVDCSWSGAFDYQTIGEAADYVQIMTYDEHGTWSEDGPISSLPWMEKTLSYAVKEIPSKKILLGLPSYVYDWDLTEPTLNKAAANSKYWDVSAQWDESSKSAYYYYRDTDSHHHIVWFENREGIKSKANLVKKYNLGGVSIWKLGTENEEYWKAVHAGLH